MLMKVINEVADRNPAQEITTTEGYKQSWPILGGADDEAQKLEPRVWIGPL
jgi:hypothetical protein